jgi:DNA (cytosine-5)-methyltransferase 1
MEGLVQEGRGPRIIVLENVVGAITSHDGRDFRRIVREVSGAGYRVGAMVIDAIGFLPQSRPRLFIVAADAARGIPVDVTGDGPTAAWHPGALRDAFDRLPNELQQSWEWWELLEPPEMTAKLSDVLEDEPSGVTWHSQEHTRYLISLMSDVNRKKLRDAQASKVLRVGTIYRRTRPNGNGGKQQRAEVRFDEVAGCLRTPAGGSSRQTVVVVEGAKVRSRLLSPREAARLMGVPEDYPMPENYNEAYHLFGDGLAVPAVSWLNAHLLLPLAEAQGQQAAA